MRLAQLIRSFDDYNIYPEPDDFEVEGITCNSKNVLDNFIFVAIKGDSADGNAFIEEAIEKGAKAVIVESSEFRADRSYEVPVIVVKNTRRAAADLAAEFYGNPSKKIKVVGITGTNGKTTVSYLIEALLKERGEIPGVLGTINYRFKDKIIPAKNTTPGPIELQSMLAEMLKEGAGYCLMEVSSHALHQERIKGIKFHSAIFTNLTQDHLDYHNTIEDYFQAKARLFKDLNSDSFVLINTDDAFARRLKGLTQSAIISYGIENAADITAKDIKFDISRSEFVLSGMGRKIKIKTNLIGRHNVYNILASIAWAIKEGLDLSTIKSAIEKFYLIPGRLERVDCGADFSVFIDYAHTEDALSNVIATLREVSDNRIIVVFGCGGERDKTKRPRMGRVVSESADYAFITNDNPRSEDPEDIINDIKSGIKRDNYCVIPDRMEAIKKSLSIAKTGDIILIAGKGHEDYQILNDRVLEFDDGRAVRECLKSMKY